MFVNIEAERARSGLSKTALAKTLGICTKTYSNWLNGKTDIPAKKLIEMSKMWGTTADYLLGVAEPPDKGKAN